MCSVHHFNRSNITLFIPFKTVKWETCPVLSFFLLLLRTELSWNIKTIKVKIANWRASCLDSSYIYCIEGFLRRQNKSGNSLSVFNSSFSPHWKCHCPPPFPSFTFPASQWPRLSPSRCTDGAHCKTAKIICETERRALRATIINVLEWHCHT